MDQDKMSNLYKGPSIDASYQVSVHLAEGFQRRRLKCEKLTETWPPQVILVSDWLVSKNSSPLKPPGQMNQNLVGTSLEGSL
jgi:hypothetical protein